MHDGFGNFRRHYIIGSDLFAVDKPLHFSLMIKGVVVLRNRALNTLIALFIEFIVHFRTKL